MNHEDLVKELRAARKRIDDLESSLEVASDQLLKVHTVIARHLMWYRTLKESFGTFVAVGSDLIDTSKRELVDLQRAIIEDGVCRCGDPECKGYYKPDGGHDLPY